MKRGDRRRPLVTSLAAALQKFFSSGRYNSLTGKLESCLPDHLPHSKLRLTEQPEPGAKLLRLVLCRRGCRGRRRVRVVIVADLVLDLLACVLDVVADVRRDVLRGVADVRGG